MKARKAATVSFPLPGGDKEHRLVGSIEVDEHCHVDVAALGCGLVEADRGDITEVEPRHRTADVERQHAPQPLVGDPDDPGDGGDRHLAHQHQSGLLEQQRKAAVGPRPGNLDPQHPVLGAVDPRDARADVARVLKEVQMPPGVVLPVVRLAGPAAFRAREQRARRGGDRQVQFVGLAVGLQTLIDHPPRRRQPEPQGENVTAAHRALCSSADQAKGSTLAAGQTRKLGFRVGR